MKQNKIGDKPKTLIFGTEFEQTINKEDNIDRLAKFKDIKELTEIKEVRRLEAKLEEIEKGHGKKMSANEFLKELGKW